MSTSANCICTGLQGPPGPQGLPGYGAGSTGWAIAAPPANGLMTPDLSAGLTQFIYLTSTAVTTGTAAANSPNITVANASNILAGHYVNGAGIVPGTTVLSGSGTVNLVLSQPTMAALPAGTPVTFSQQVTVQPPVWSGNILLPGMAFNVLTQQDALGNHPSPLFEVNGATLPGGTTVVGGFASDANTKYPITTGNTWTIWRFMYTGTLWICTDFWTNIAGA